MAGLLPHPSLETPDSVLQLSEKPLDTDVTVGEGDLRPEFVGRAEKDPSFPPGRAKAGACS